MALDKLIERIAGSVSKVPARADVITLHQPSLSELQTRAKRFLATVGEAFQLPVGRADWSEREARTLIRLPQGSWAEYHHASGAMKIVAGLSPMESLFDGPLPRDALVKLVEETSRRINLREFIGQNESVQFERLWSIKAGAAGREGKAVEPVLCRIVGAYRHHVGELPVLGAASVAIKLAGGGKLDALEWYVRETTKEVLDRPQILPPDQGARQIALQLQTLFGQSKINLDEAAKPEWVRFGYFSLPKRKAQRVFAPVYAATIVIEGQQEAQGYVFVVPATEKTYLPLELAGSAPPKVEDRKSASSLKPRRVKVHGANAPFGLIA
jgi:hypothetical protein